MPKRRSQHTPKVRDGLCRLIRSKGMLVNVGDDPANDSAQRQYLAFDPNALPWDGTVWWCTRTSKTIGPDDRPCSADRCVAGRICYEAEDEDAPVA
jgi:hypothetical protein